MFKKITLTAIAGAALISQATAHEYHVHEDWVKPANGEKYIGNGHGEIAVDKAGLVYVSVMAGPNAGVQIFDSTGKYVKNIKGAPKDFHGFVIHQEADKEYIYGACLVDQKIIKMTLDGEVVLSISGNSIPEKYRNMKKPKQQLKLTSVDVAANGDLYIADGYGLDFIHRFDKAGKYISSFGGKAKPYSFNNCHKVFVDRRYTPERLLCTNRNKKTLVHLSLGGEFIEVHAKNLRRPSSIAFKGDEIAVAEIVGRITILNKKGEIVSVISENPAKYKGNRWAPSEWKKGIVGSPHGITFDAEGNILMTEYNKSGRLMRFNLKKLQESK